MQKPGSDIGYGFVLAPMCVAFLFLMVSLCLWVVVMSFVLVAKGAGLGFRGLELRVLRAYPGTGG